MAEPLGSAHFPRVEIDFSLRLPRVEWRRRFFVSLLRRAPSKRLVPLNAKVNKCPANVNSAAPHAMYLTSPPLIRVPCRYRFVSLFACGRRRELARSVWGPGVHPEARDRQLCRGGRGLRPSHLGEGMYCDPIPPQFFCLCVCLAGGVPCFGGASCSDNLARAVVEKG